MRYSNIVKAEFIDRPNRFIANVMIDDVKTTVHVKNTGRCRELLKKGAQVILEKSGNPARKTLYDLVGVYKEGTGLVNIDSQAPNKVVGEWLRKNCFLTDVTNIKAEYTFGDSRIDFYFERDGRKCLMEVKGVTLEREGVCYFPDAPTLRGVKHLNELAAAAAAGFDCYIAFVIQMEGVNVVRVNIDTHPEFGAALDNAKAAGVTVLNLGCKVGEASLEIDRSFVR